jgi:hypothetical protein
VTATQQKRAGRPQEIAKAKAAKLHARHARVAKDDRSHNPIRRKTVRVARIKREADKHIRYVQGERHRRA